MSTHKKVHYRANLQDVVETIHSLSLSQQQKTELKRTPFWLLIEAILNNTVEYDKCKRHDKVITKIISYFEKPYLKIAFENYEMQIDEMDVRLIFGIKDGGMKLEVYSENFYIKPFLRRCFPERIGKPQYRLGIPLIRKALVEASRKTTNADAQDVARLVTLYILATLLIPSTSSNLPWTLTTILDDMDAICNHNWSGLVIDRLIASFNERKVKNHAGCVVMLPYWLCEHTKIVEPMDTQCFPRFLKWDLEQFGKILMRTDLKDLNSDDIVQGSLKASEKEKTLFGDKNVQQPLNEEVQQHKKELEPVLLDWQTSKRDVGTSANDIHRRGKRALDTLYNVPPAKKPHSGKMVMERKKCSSYLISCTTGVKDDIIPEWAQVLECVNELINANPGDWIQRCVKESLEKKPPEWAKTVLESLISKGLYNERDLEPTKEAIISILRIVRCGALSWMTENRSSQCPSDVKTTPRPFNHHHELSILEDNELTSSADTFDSTYSSVDEIPLKLPFSNVKDVEANSCKARGEEKSIVLRAEVDLIKSRDDEREAFKALDMGRVNLEFQMFNSMESEAFKSSDESLPLRESSHVSLNCIRIVSTSDSKKDSSHLASGPIEVEVDVCPEWPQGIESARKLRACGNEDLGAKEKTSSPGYEAAIPSMPMSEDLMEDEISLSNPFSHSEKCQVNSFEAHRETSSHVLKAKPDFINSQANEQQQVSETLNENLLVEKDITKTADKAEPSSAPLLAISKILESAYIAKESFENLKKENEKLASELALVKSDLVFSNSRVQELKQKLVSDRVLADSQIQELEKELKDERVRSNLKSKKGLEAMKAMEKRLAHNLLDAVRKEVAQFTESII